MIKVGSRVRFISDTAHRTHPKKFPVPGTIGVVVMADSNIGVTVQWPAGSTSYNDLWWTRREYVEEIDVNKTNRSIKYDRLLKIAKAMHEWIFLNAGDEQEAYDEIGLTDEENEILGYYGRLVLDGRSE